MNFKNLLKIICVLCFIFAPISLIGQNPDDGIFHGKNRIRIPFNDVQQGEMFWWEQHDKPWENHQKMMRSLVSNPIDFRLV